MMVSRDTPTHDQECFLVGHDLIVIVIQIHCIYFGTESAMIVNDGWSLSQRAIPKEVTD